MSFPFYGKQFTFTQPDGTKLEVKGWGDQHHAVFETLDGYTVVEDPVTGFYQYAQLSHEEAKPTGILPNVGAIVPSAISKGIRSSKNVIKSKVFSSEGLPPGNSRWRQRRREEKSNLLASILSAAAMPAPPKRQTVGNFVGLCLLIEFPDIPATIPATEVEAFCNQVGYNGYSNNGSVYDYFLDNSSGKLKYTNIIAPYYTAKNPRDYYTKETITQPIRAIELIEEALTYHKANGFDFSQLTSDNQDYVYALNVFYAGNVVNRWAKGLWPHSYNLNAPFVLTTGKFANDYQITNMGSELTLGTFCHENGHMVCDFPDLYDYGYESRGVGAYCLMCAGGNANPKNPVQIGGYLKYKAGWADRITRLSAGLSATTLPGKNDFYILSKNKSEYYLLENRSKSGRDFALPCEGLTIWHVDEFGDNSNEQMTALSHYECSLVQADNQNDLENGTNDGDPNDLFSSGISAAFGASTSPRFAWWDGATSGIEISNIGATGTSTTFTVI